MRHLISLGLCVCVVGTSAAQTEVIIRRPGEKDQVIQLDSAHTREALARAQAELNKAATSIQQRVLEMEQQLSHERLSELPQRISTLAQRNTELATRNIVEPMIAQLTERFRQPKIGIGVETRTRDSDKWGAYVTWVTPGSPADRAGILSGDIIMRIAGKSLTERPAKNDGEDESNPGVRLINIVSQLQPGKPVDIELRRGTQNRTVKVTPIEDDSPSIARLMPDRMPTTGSYSFTMPGQAWAGKLATPEPMTLEAPSMSIFSNGTPGSFFYSFGSNGLFANLELVSLNEKLGSYFGASEGVLVVSTEARRPFEDAVAMPRDVVIRKQGDGAVARAPRAGGTVVRSGGGDTVYADAAPAQLRLRRAPIDIGLEPGDVIVSVDGRKVSTPSQLMRIVGTYDRGEEFKLQIMRQKRAESLNVKMP